MQVTDIKPYIKNAKEHPAWHIEKIANSIKAFGCKQPVVIDGDGTIVAGHGRFTAMTELLGYTILEPRASTKKGEPVIPYVIADDLTEDEIKAYRIADNQINALTGQNEDIIFSELKELDTNGFDITLTGFDQDFILDEDENDDVVPEAPKKSRTKKGDIYKLGNHVLICGDSTDPETYKELLGEVKADMVFTDPPYNINYKGQGKNTSNVIIGDDILVGEFDGFLKKVFANLAKFTKQGAGNYVFHASRTQAQFEKALEVNNYEIKNQLIWNKPMSALGWGDYRWKHEPFFYAGQKGQSLQFYGDRTHSTVWDFQKSEQQLLNWAKKQKKAEIEGKTTVWSMKRDNVQDYVHPTQKPVELITYALLNSSKQEDVILDPFGGSGSTLIACEKSGRVCRTIELDPKYCDVIVQRYVDYVEDGSAVVIKNGKTDTWERSVIDKE